MKAFGIITMILQNLLILNISVFAQKASVIVHDRSNKIITLSDSSRKLVLQLNYSRGCVLDKITVKGIEVTGSGNSVYSGIRFGDKSFTSKKCSSLPVITIAGNTLNVSSIKFGDTTHAIEEDWVFKIQKNDIQWRIKRHYLNKGTIDENFFPCWQFNSMQTWDGSMLDNGGVAWCRFLDKVGTSYGTHASALTFWNRLNNTCFKIIPENDPNTFMSAIFSHLPNNVLSVIQSSSAEERDTKYGLRRFITTGQDVFAPAKVDKPDISISYTLQALSYNKTYDRGILKGIKEESVNEMFNTIGRYGVVDKNLYGSNGWRTGWAVLQEPWLALFGLAINSPDFINGFSKTLEYEKEHAIMPDGRVLPRWHHDSSDAMPNTFRDNGFYECQWGYMLDSQPAYAIDVAEQFDMNGDIDWLRQFKLTCEKVLYYMIKRDSDGNGLFEVIQNTHKEQKGSDWMDVVWTSYEVASINAYMYKALVRWSDLENLLGDKKMSEKYQHLALKLKTAFNKNISDGGFWNPDKKWYVYWREKDGSVYGNNLVSMVNFLAIGYELCDNEVRKDAILQNMEELMQKEKLFIWPSCFFPYEDSVGLSNVNYPYPNYENGDLFLAWAELGTRCYAEKYPEIALRNIRNVIKQYELDGLSHQRYTRLKQTGAGDDILSNNIMAVVGLYRNIYGIQPKYNRLYLEPNITNELNGTQLKYWLRNKNYLINLSKEKYTISTDNFSVSNKHPFAVNFNENELEYFNGNKDHFSLKISAQQRCSVDILNWGEDIMSWKETGKSSKSNINHEVHNLKTNTVYRLLINNTPIKKYTSGLTGLIRFDCPLNKDVIRIEVVKE